MFLTSIININIYQAGFVGIAILSLLGIILVYQGFKGPKEEVPSYPQPREYSNQKKEKGLRFKLSGWFIGGLIGLVLYGITYVIFYLCGQGTIPFDPDIIEDVFFLDMAYIPYSFQEEHFVFIQPIIYFLVSLLIAGIYNIFRTLSKADVSPGLRRVALSLSLFSIANIAILLYSEVRFIMTEMLVRIPAVPNFWEGIFHIIGKFRPDVFELIRPISEYAYLDHLILIAVFLLFMVGFLCAQLWVYLLFLPFAFGVMINAICFLVSFPGERLDQTIINGICLIYFAVILIFCLHPDVKKQFSRRPKRRVS